MRDLMEIRQQIDEIDQKMLSLFKQRMRCSADVAEYKRGTGKAIYDPVRERQMLISMEHLKQLILWISMKIQQS